MDLSLVIDTDCENNRRLRNAPKSTPKDLRLYKFSDFTSDNVSFELCNVTVLEISNCDISEIPPNIRKFNLKQLILTRNKLEEVPCCLYSGCETLELLDLSHNLLTEFHIAPECNESIIVLKLSDNRIKNFPHWVQTMRCPKLQEVYYSKNFIVKFELVQELFLKKLELCNCKLMDCDFVFLKKIKRLEFLDIGNDNSSRNENMFKELNNLFQRHKWKNMLVLKFNNLLLSVIPSGIFYLASLKELHLIGCDLNWIPEDVQYLQNLKLLDVTHNAICALPEHLTQLRNLSIIKAAFNNISMIENFNKNLEILDLYSNQLEKITFCICQISYIDLEQNLLDTSNLGESETYKMRLSDYREKFNLVRQSGPVERPQTPTDESDDHSSDEWSEHSDYQDFGVEDNEDWNENTTKFYDPECWDDDKKKEVKVRNPEVTPSDDEWNGNEEIDNKKKEKLKNLLQFDADEDWIFEDVDGE